MAKVFIIGAAGKVGSRLATLLAAGGHTVLALHRKPEQADALAAIVERPDLGRIIIELTEGDQPIGPTLDRLAGR